MCTIRRSVASDEGEGRQMAESGRNCVECGRPVAMFSGITINGAAYHNHCWDRSEPVSGVMPAVEHLQLGNTRAVKRAA